MRTNVILFLLLSLAMQLGAANIAEDLTECIANNDFEYSQPGVKNPVGNIARGIPTGWTAYVKRGNQEWLQTISDGVNTTALPNQSYGINQGANDIHATNVFWVNTTPMPDAFKLYQTIPAEKLEKGKYSVQCRLSCIANKLTNVRLYANSISQYYGKATDYDANIVANETYTFAGYDGCTGNDGDFYLLDMSVDVELADGEDLELGIKSSCFKKDGSKATDNSGWFKVDYFQLYRVNDQEEPIGPRTITSFRDYRANEGTSHTIDGMMLSDPDIYYYNNGNDTYKAYRLTVQPVEEPAEMTPPYLNQATANSIQVCWKTKSKNDGSIVRFGTSESQLDQQITSTAKQIAANYYWHTAQLTGLNPNTVYYYQVTSGEKTSAIGHFRTMPQASSKEPFRILIIGDHQRNERSDYEWLIRMAERKAQQKWGNNALEDNIRLLMNVGDQVDSGSVRQYEFTHLYKSREVMSRLPIMTCVGNHELFKDPELKLYEGHYSSYGDIEYQGIKSNTAFYYAYQAGPVLFVVMNTDGTSNEQKQWVKRVIQAADNDATVRFIVSVQHRPLFAEQWASDTNPWMTNEIMPILSASKKHVLNCAGHHHLYARGQMTQWPVYHMITGGGVGTSAQDYEQLWGNTPDNRNRDEVQKTIDQWTYQLLEFDPVKEEITVETYSIGNSRLALDNVLIDCFSRKVYSTDKPVKPTLNLTSNEIALPATITQQNAQEGLHSCEYQIARDANFTDIVFQHIQLFEDFYDVDANYLPKNQNEGKLVNTFELTTSDLPSGNYYLRCRNRSKNLDWSDYSDVKAITVTGSTVAALSLTQRFYKPGSPFEIAFQNAPVGTEAWVGIYVKGKRPGTEDVSYAYKYTEKANGTLSFTINDANEYFAVLFGDGGYNEISQRIPFVVTNYATDEQPPLLSVDKQTYVEGEPIKVSFQHAPALKNDWIGIYEVGMTPENSKCPTYLYTNELSEGTITLNVEGTNNFISPLPAGDYFACYFMADNYSEATERVPFTITKDKVEGMTMKQGNTVIVVPQGESSQVKLAIEALQRDFQKVMGFKPAIVNTLGTTEGIELVIVNQATDGVQVLEAQKELTGFESHAVYADAAHRRVYLQGADMRGTIYAIYSLSEQILGVPPLWYWCEWQPEQLNEIDIDENLDYYQPSPTVRYRAWFPNDEDLFVPWRRLSTDNNERWLETMLRLKLNTVEYTATVTTNGTLNSEAMLYKKYGLVLTSHHMVALNNSFANWDAYWQQVEKTTPPTLSVNDMTSLRKFWQYNINSVMNSGVENLWQVAFRGKTDQPFWSVFSDAPSSDAERAAVINRMVKEQYDMICQSTGEENPFVRMTFYDEISSLLAAGHLQPPTATNLLWTFVAGRRDHYPYDDLVNWTNTNNVKLGYYMNLQFYSTGAHLAPAEGPWKMEDNYRYVQSKGPLTFSVVNAGNLREFLMEMSANAAMMWNSDSYNTNDFMRQFCAQYFGKEHANEIAQLYHDYYYAYWNPKKSDFPGGFDRQYVFQDLRHSQVIKQIDATWKTFKVNPFTEIGYESVTGRTFRIEGRNPVDSVLAGMSREMEAFAAVAHQCETLQSQLPTGSQTFFYDHLSAYAHYMEQLSTAVYHYVYAYKNKEDRYNHLKTAYEAMKAAKVALIASQHGVFSTWYATDDKFEMDNRIETIRKHMVEEEVEDLTLTEQLIENYDFEYNHDCQPNAIGNIGRGIPCGWESLGELKKGANGLDSYGVNQGASNYHGNNVCWMNSVPMPDEFWLYQTIPASKLVPGTYRVRCKLWVENGKKTCCRLFANKNVQYYGTENDYTSLLTEGEVNTYAGYAGGNTDEFVLKDMEVSVDIKEGEDLMIGIKTGNMRNNGERSTNDNAGWFKVDYFRIHRIATTEVNNSVAPLSNGTTLLYTLTGIPVTSAKKGLYVQHKNGQNGKIIIVTK